MFRIAIRKRYLIAFTSLILFLLLFQIQLIPKPNIFEQHKYFSYDVDKEEPLQLDQTCQLPRVHPFDPSILDYLLPPKSIKCKVRQYSLTFIDNEGLLRFNETSLKIVGYNASDLKCHYQEIIRETDFKVSYGEKLKLSTNGTRIDFDFIYVSCSKFGGIVFYTNIHCHVVPKTLKNKPNNLNKNMSYYNVLMVGIDSVSRLSFIRYLPETYEFLTKDLKAFVFRGMTKIGDNTFPNLAAILTGRSVFNKELPNIDDPKAKHDNWPCLWKNFSRAKYVTLFAEDQPQIGMFTYLRGGFQNPPTDHYMTPFWLAVQSSKLLYQSSSLCFGTTPKHLLMLNYTRTFIEKYSKLNIPFFAFSFFVELSHDYMRVVSSADRDFRSWLSDLYRSGFLNNTFLIFLSDHGHRFDVTRATLIGRIEERMPFFSIVVPPSIYKNYPQVIDALNINVRRLTTPFDIHASALDILNFQRTGSKIGSVKKSRGTTLFIPIPNNRTCISSGIPDHYCVCETEERIPSTDYRSVRASTVLLSAINNLLSAHGNFCSELAVTEIIRSDLIALPRKVIVNSRIYFGKLKEDSPAKGMFGKLRIIIKTAPGDAMFEATLRFRDDDCYDVLGDISRINKYGSQSKCIDDAVLRKYCFCKNQTNVDS